MFARSIVVIFLFILCGLFADSAIATDNHEIIQKPHATALGAGDVLKITIFGEDNLSGTYQIQTDSTISIPLLGDINIAGLTLQQAQEKIENALADGYLVAPKVSLEVDAYRSFYIIGEVKTPGQYEYQDNLSALNAVAIAGGFTYRAKKNTFKVLREQNADPEHSSEAYQKIEANAPIMPGDVLLIEERFF